MSKVKEVVTKPVSESSDFEVRFNQIAVVGTSSGNTGALYGLDTFGHIWVKPNMENATWLRIESPIETR